VYIEGGNETSMLGVPVDALVSADEKEGIVFIYQDGQAVKTKVSIYKLRGDEMLISRGLRAEDQVITSGVGYIEDKEAVMLSQN
ncbi:MAG: hypothetical protein MRY78_07605, partial [Saprospiraceae bacterium]|nr:hypothetical protein [Saprospiraceae bacterium]